MPLPTGLAPFRHQRFARLWAGAVVSSVGSWMASVTVGILVTERTGQAAWTGIAAAVALVPSAVIAPFGGALADRVSRRALLLGTTTVQVVAAAVLAVLASADHISPAAITLVVLLDGCASAIAFPLFTALVPELVPRADEIPHALSLATAQHNLGRVIGPALAVLLIEVAGYASVFVVRAASAMAILIAVVSIRLDAPPEIARASFLASIGEGIRFARQDSGMRALVTLYTLALLLVAPFIALVPAMAIEVLNAGKGGTSVLVTAQGIGSIVAAVLVAAIVGHVGVRRLTLASYVLYPIGLVVYALAPSLSWCVPAIFVLGMLNVTTFSGFTTIAQLRSPPELRGRVASLLVAVLGIAYPLASIVQGAIGDVIGLRVTMVGAAVILSVTFWALRLVRPGFDADLRDPLANPARTDVRTAPVLGSV